MAGVDSNTASISAILDAYMYLNYQIKREGERYEKLYFTIANSTAIDRFSRVQYDKKQI